MLTGLILAAAGILILAAVSFDFLYTAIGAAPNAPLSDRVARRTWRLLKRLMGRGWALHRLAGPVVMTLVAANWIILVSVGWTLIHQGAERAVVTTDTGAPVSWVLDFAYIGHLLSTLGGGVTSPGGPVWTVLAVLVGVNGMVILTLSVSFVLSTTQAVAQGRALLTKAEMYAPGSEGMANTVLPQLADLVASLNSVQFALYYSSPERARRLPEGLVDLAEQLRGHPAQLRQFKTAVIALPGLDPGSEGEDDDAFIARLGRWAEPYAL